MIIRLGDHPFMQITDIEDIPIQIFRVNEVSGVQSSNDGAKFFKKGDQYLWRLQDSNTFIERSGFNTLEAAVADANQFAK